jgi:hypothetical protein
MWPGSQRIAFESANAREASIFRALPESQLTNGRFGANMGDALFHDISGI